MIAYATDITNTRKQRLKFNEELESLVDKIQLNDSTIIIGDLNTRIGGKIIPGIKQRFHESTHNDNGDVLIELYAQNNLRINKTFFDPNWNPSL